MFLRLWPITLVLSMSLCVSAEESLPEDARPVAAGNLLVVPLTGEVVGRIPGASVCDAAAPIPGAPGQFRVGKVSVDAATRRTLAERVPEISLESQRITRRTPDGEVSWSREIAGRVGGVRPPDHVCFERFVAVVVDEGVTVFDRETGVERWRADGEHDRLLSSGALLLATRCSSPPPSDTGRCLVAREWETGTEVFRTRLPDDSDPAPIEEVAGMFLVKDVGFAGTHPAYARFFDRAGALRLELPDCPSACWSVGDDMIVVSPRRTARITMAGQTRWESADLVAAHDAAEIVALPNGDLLGLAWEAFADSGATVVRIGAADGKVVWKTQCPELGVPHSKYWHRCYVEVRTTGLVIVSQGAGGHFVEVLDPTSGKSIRRTVLDGPGGR